MAHAPKRDMQGCRYDSTWARSNSISENCKNAIRDAKQSLYGARLPKILGDSPKRFWNFVINSRPSSHISLTDENGVPVGDDNCAAISNDAFVSVLMGE